MVWFVDGEDFVIDGFMKYEGYGDECRGIYFAGIALFHDEENKENGNLVFRFVLSTRTKPMIANISAMKS